MASEPEDEDEDATGAFRRVMRLLTPKQGSARSQVGLKTGEVGRPLVLGLDDQVRRHFLEDRVVDVGSSLEVHLADGTWVAGRYDWSKREGEPPLLRIVLEGGAEATIELPPNAVLRWRGGG